MRFVIYTRRSARSFWGRSQLFFLANYDNFRRYNGIKLPFELYHVAVVSLPIVRYGQKHIGLGTKRFVDSLGSC